MIAMLETRGGNESAQSGIRSAIHAARLAQTAWGDRSAAERARVIARLRPILAENVSALSRAAAAVSGRPVAEKIVAEVLPLIEAARFLGAHAPRILRTKRHGRSGRPLWLRGHTFTVERKPFGVVLIVGPGNYPLFLPAVQALHALAAGNAVLIKPAERCTAVISAFVELVWQIDGFPKELIQILPETRDAAWQAVELGIDKAIFTGSSENGRDFLSELAQTNTPSAMELSGQDVVYVRADAEVERAARAIAFGRTLNAGDTCMAPHTLLVHHALAPALAKHLRELGVNPDALIAVRDDAEALKLAAENEHGLGASIFSRDEAAAYSLARRFTTGFVTINDLIVPTADPRFPFGGTRASGYGVTRGEEGLLEMTYPQAVATRRARTLPHLNPSQAGDADLFAAFIQSLHGKGFWNRLRALRTAIGLARERPSAKSPHEKKSNEKES